MTYAEVVEKAKKQVNERSTYGNRHITYKSCDTWINGDQINLWAYWQGYQIEDIDAGVDILLVGQDWGNPDRNPEVIRRIEMIQQGRTDLSYHATVSPTDRNMTAFFAVLNCDITKKDPGRRLLFTNYSLGYRSGSETGGMTKSLMLEDKELFEDLVAAVKPKMIICLGKLTYEAVCGSVAHGFLERIKKGMPFKSHFYRNESIPVYGVPHCGARGLNNAGGKAVVFQVWNTIARDQDI